MATITPGTGATIAATTAEGQAFQIFQWWQMQEENLQINPLEQEYFVGNKNTDTGNKFFEGTWKIPVTFVPGSSLILTAVDLYSLAPFTPGTPLGTFVGSTAAAYTLHLIFWLISRQKNSAYNPDQFDYISAKYDAKTGFCEGTFNLPYTTSLLANGATQDMARPYLL